MRPLRGAGVLVWLAIAVGVVSPAGAQPTLAPIVNPPGVRLRLDLTDAGPFREMQIIRGSIQLERQSQHAAADGAVPMWSLTGYLVDPPLGEGVDRCGLPERPCARHYLGRIMEGHFWGGGHPEQEGPKPLRITERLPRLAPGAYRIAAVATHHNVYQSAAPAQPASPPPVVIAVSNWVPLTILPATEAWIQQTLTQNRPSPNPPHPDEGFAANRVWLDSIHQLQLLDHPAAWEVIASTTFNNNPPSFEGLLSTRHPEQACAWMRQGLDNPRRRVDVQYLHTAYMVCLQAELPPMPRPRNEGSTPSPEYQAAMRAYTTRQQEWHGEQIEMVGERLLASLPQREGEILSEALGVLLGLIPTAQQQKQVAQIRASGQIPRGFGFAGSFRLPFRSFSALGQEPSWASRFRLGLPQWLASLDPQLRAPLLNRVVNHMESPEWAPVLEAELLQLGPGDSPGTVLNLIHPLAALDAKRAANLVAAQLRKPATWLQPDMLAFLPQDPQPFSDAELVEMLASPREPGTNHFVWQAAVARFASPEAAPRLRQHFEQNRPNCQPALVGYFLRADPEYAATILGGAWDMRDARHPCQLEYLMQTPNYGMGPVLEKFLIAHLFHNQVPLKQAAAAALQRRGGPAAQEALWEAMRQFQRSWKGREEELSRHSEANQFEFVLAAALTQARHWILPPEDLRKLDALCTGNPCRQQTTSALSVWKQPIGVNGYNTFGQFHGHVGQHNANSREELLARIRQLPPGTRVRISAGGPDPGPLRSAMLTEAAAAGLIVE
jgi:hypothetical protein